METRNVLVTDAQMRSSLAVIRSLGKKGIHVTGGEDTKYSTGFFSKYCNNKVVYPSPKKKPDAFIRFLINELQTNTYDVLFPVADACLKPIIDHEEEISQYTKIALPPRDIFLKGYDKGNTLKIAMDNNIPCPQTFFLDNIDDLIQFTNNFSYPAVIKPTISSGSRGKIICHNFEQLETSCKHLFPIYRNLLIQEFIPNGGEFGIYTLFSRHSEPRALTVQKRIRSYPQSGGPSTFRESIKTPFSEYAVEIAFKLLKLMRWQGIAMVEFRIDPRDGLPKLMEVNPRFWGSLQLSILSGVDFPFLYYQYLMEGDIDPHMDYQAGVQCRWLLPGDILWYLTSPNKIKNLKEFFRFDIPDDIISWDDPGPTLGFMVAAARYLFDQEMWKFVLRRE